MSVDSPPSRWEQAGRTRCGMRLGYRVSADAGRAKVWGGGCQKQPGQDRQGRLSADDTDRPRAQIRRLVSTSPSDGCPCLRTESRSDGGISPSRWEQAGRTDCGSSQAVGQPAGSQTARLQAGAHRSGAPITARPDMQGRHLFFFCRGRDGRGLPVPPYFSIGARILQDRRPTACGITGVGSSRGEG